MAITKDYIEDELSKLILMDEIEEWWEKPNIAFQDRKPSEVLKSNPEELELMLYRLKTGMPE